MSEIPIGFDTLNRDKQRRTLNTKAASHCSAVAGNYINGFVDDAEWETLVRETAVALSALVVFIQANRPRPTNGRPEAA